MALGDSIPDNPAPYLRHVPSIETRRVYGRSVYADGTAIRTPPKVHIENLPAYSVADEVMVHVKDFDAVLLDQTASTPMAGVWYADIPCWNDSDAAPGGLCATISHNAWDAPETRRAFLTDPPKVPWIELQLAESPVVPGVRVNVVWVSGGPKIAVVQEFVEAEGVYPPGTLVISLSGN